MGERCRDKLRLKHGKLTAPVGLPFRKRQCHSANMLSLRHSASVAVVGVVGGGGVVFVFVVSPISVRMMEMMVMMIDDDSYSQYSSSSSPLVVWRFCARRVGQDFHATNKSSQNDSLFQ